MIGIQKTNYWDYNMKIPEKARRCPTAIFRRRRLSFYNPQYVYQSQLKKTAIRVESEIDSLPSTYFVGNYQTLPVIGNIRDDLWNNQTPISKKKGHEDFQFTIEDYLNASNRRQYTKNELSPEQLENAKQLLKKVNAVTKLLGKYTDHPERFVFTSGFRNYAHQMRVNPDSPNSLHTKGMALDISDPTGELKKIIMEHPEIIKEIQKQGLNVENFYKTSEKNGKGGWIHFDTGQRQQTGNMIWTGEDLERESQKYLQRRQH